MSEDLPPQPEPPASNPPPSAVPPAAASAPAARRAMPPRLGSSYIGDLQADDAQWKTAAFTLTLLLVLICLAEAMTVWANLLSDAVPLVFFLALLRVILLGELFVGLWVGWDWLRWVGGSIAALYGVWRTLWSLILHNNAPPVSPAAAAVASSQWDLPFVITLSAGLLYMAFGAYLVISDGAADFARHRREKGGRGEVLAVFFALFACFGLLFAVKPLHKLWLAHLQAQALRFGEQSLRDMAANWDPLVYEANMSPAYAAQWPKNTGRSFFASMKKYGPIQRIDHPAAPLNVSIDAMGHLTMMTVYKAHVAFAQGGADYETDIETGLLTPWRQGRFTLGFDSPPAPAAAPAPTAAPAAPAPVPAAPPAQPSGAAPAPSAQPGGALPAPAAGQSIGH